MKNTLNDFIQEISTFDSIPIQAMKDVRRCHVTIPDMDKPVGAVFYNNSYYSYVMAYTKKDAAHRGAHRLSQKGNRVLLTRTPRGLILWVAEPDAQRVWSS